MHYEVFYIDNSTGWAFAKFDKSRNQVSEAEFYFHKREAVMMANEEANGLEVRVFTKNGRQQGVSGK